MTRRRLTALAALLLLSVDIAVSAGDARLQVLLQGESASDIAALVRDTGGEVTHDLHIINAVGALVTAAQLAELKRSTLISRTIDDLAHLDERAPREDTQTCRVRGHIELDLTEDGFRWRLYNKRAEPAHLERIALNWPAQLGALEELRLDRQVLHLEPTQRDKHTGMTVEVPTGRLPVIRQRAELVARFSKPTAQDGFNAHQRDFGIELGFAAGCGDKLVPAYDDNAHDYYYNRVSGVERLHQQGITGKGVTVAVIDSGLWEHDALALDTTGKPRIVGRYDAIHDVAGKTARDESGHGTHMTSIIANSASTLVAGKANGSYRGVAPDANLVAVKVLDKGGLAHLLEIVRAVQWVVEQREALNIRVLNLSFARTPGWLYWEDPVNQSVMRAWDAGITVLAAAGNEGPDDGSVGSPGNTPYVITVGAVTDSWTPETRADDYVPDFSSRGPTNSGHIKPDLVALGGHMTGLINPDSAMAIEQPEDILRGGEFVSTGSSQATAFASGVVALLLQLEPGLTPDDIKCKLISSAEPAINRDGRLAYSPFQQGYGYLNPVRAITLGRTGCGNEEWDITTEWNGGGHYSGPAIMAEDGSASLPGMTDFVDPHPSEEGYSDNRVWGVKGHIERLDSNKELPQSTKNPYDWYRLYLMEKERIENLARQPSK